MMRHARRIAVLVLWVGLGACRPEPRRTVAAPAAVDAELLRTMTMLATARSPSHDELDRAQRQLAAGQRTMSSYIDELVTGDAFATQVAPLIILRQLLSQNALGAPEGFVLAHSEAARPVYYLHEPCAARDAVPVHAWWSLLEGRDETLLVCPDSYRPERWTAQVPPGEPETACLSEAAQTETHECGCGPNLLRCFSSADHQKQVAQSLRDELQRSIAYNVAANLPVEQIFTSNQSFRDRNAEFFRRTLSAESERRAISEASFRELAAWPAAGRWAARDDLAPGQNAGILSSPQLIHYQLDRRQRMTTIEDVLWCIEADSVGATPETLLSIVGADLQIKSDGWRDLAGRPICTNCHARLDYGFQFFWGFANDNLQAYFVPGLQLTGRGPLYVRDIQDPRGEADLTPLGFAQLAVAQPEFRRCMARDFTEYVLGNQVSPGQVAAVQAVMRPNATSARELMRAALQRLADGRSRRAEPARAAPSAPSSPPRARIAVTAGLRAQLDEHCMDCHDQEAGRPDLAPAELDRATVVGMLESTAFGKMPKDLALPEADRARFLDSFIAALWTGEDAAAAHAYFVDRSAAIPAYRPEVAFALVHQIAKSTAPTSWRMMENSVRSNVQQVTPGFITTVGLAAIEACREHHKTRAERDRCISDAIRLGNLGSQPR